MPAWQLVHARVSFRGKTFFDQIFFDIVEPTIESVTVTPWGGALDYRSTPGHTYWKQCASAYLI
jgi:hypothetical protein